MMDWRIRQASKGPVGRFFHVRTLGKAIAAAQKIGRRGRAAGLASRAGRLRSDVQRLQIGYALDRKIPALLDEIVLDAAGFSGSEDLGPIDAILADRQLGSAA